MRISLNSKKIRPDIDNSKIFNRAIETAKDKDTLVFPKGRFPTWETIIQKNKQVFWEGSVEGTEIACAHDQNGIILTAKGQVPRESHLSNLIITNAMNDHKNYKQDGLTCFIPTVIEHVEISNFYGNGAVFSGDVVSAPGTQSRGLATNMLVQSCRGNGIYVQGPDANAGTFFHIDVRDCWGYGVYDNSFLGNHWISVMCHNNRKGNFIASDPNNCAQFTGCYSEGGSPLSFMDGAAKIEGGLWDGGVILEANATANLFGKQLNSKTEAPHIYKRVHYELTGDHYYAIWQRKMGGHDLFQWRLYGKGGLGAILDKSAQDFNSKEEAIQDVQNRLNVK